jgi:hypothetical protein
VEHKRRNQQEQQRAKQERLRPAPEDVIRETIHKEYEDTVMMGGGQNEDNNQSSSN